MKSRRIVIIALALVAAGKAEEAKECCQAIIEKYPNSIEKNAAEKLLY